MKFTETSDPAQCSPKYHWIRVQILWESVSPNRVEEIRELTLLIEQSRFLQARGDEFADHQVPAFWSYGDTQRLDGHPREVMFPMRTWTFAS